jgi:hypothetical protein
LERREDEEHPGTSPGVKVGSSSRRKKRTGDLHEPNSSSCLDAIAPFAVSAQGLKTSRRLSERDSDQVERRQVMNRLRLTFVTLLPLAVAGFAIAQNADQNTAGPTKNDYRLRVIQPLEGARITGTKVQVVVDTEIPAERDTRQDVNSMPRPFVDVFLDELFQVTMRDQNNVVDLDNVAPGPHTIVLLAKNLSGEIIDRKVVHIVAVELPVAKPVAERPVSPPPPAAAPAPPAPSYEPPPAPPAPIAAEKDLPTTATSDPLFAVAGFVLLLAGIAIRRFA